MSIAGGLPLALERGLAVGCAVVQIFLKNQRQWVARPYTDDEVREFRAAWRASGIRTVFAHANYLINVAGSQPEFTRKSIAAFRGEVERALALCADYPDGGPPTITVLAEDRLQDLRMTRRSRSFEKATLADVARRIAGEHGLEPRIDFSAAVR